MRLNSEMSVLNALASDADRHPRADATYSPVIELHDMLDVLTVLQSFIMVVY